MDEETDDKRRLEQRRYARSLEINAFSKIVSALRASRKYTKKLDKNIKIVAQSLRIPDHVRRNEIRRAANDNYLSSIANCIHNENTDSEWLLASSRCVPNQPLIAPHTIFTQLANSISSILLEMNKTLPDPLPPADDAVPSIRKCNKTDLQNVRSLNTAVLSNVSTEKVNESNNINKYKSQENVNLDESCFDSSTIFTRMDLTFEKDNDSNIRSNEESNCKIIDNELNTFNKSNDQSTVQSDYRTQHTVQIPNNIDKLQSSFPPVNSKFIDAVTILENELRNDEKISDNDLLQKNFSKNLEVSAIPEKNSNDELKKKSDCDSNCENIYNVQSSNCIEEKSDDKEKITEFTANTNNIKSSSDTIDSVTIANTNLQSSETDNVELSELSQLKKEKNKMFSNDNKSASVYYSSPVNELLTDNKIGIASVHADTELKPFGEFNVLEDDAIPNTEHCLEQCINKTENMDICAENTASNTDITVTDVIFSTIIDDSDERGHMSCDKNIISVDENLLSLSASQISSVCSLSNLCNVNNKKRKLPMTEINELNCKLPRYKTIESKSTNLDSPQFLINQSKLSDKLTEGENVQEECSSPNSASSVVYMHHDYVKMNNYCPADSFEKT